MCKSCRNSNMWLIGEGCCLGLLDTEKKGKVEFQDYGEVLYLQLGKDMLFYML